MREIQRDSRMKRGSGIEGDGQTYQRVYVHFSSSLNDP